MNSLKVLLGKDIYTLICKTVWHYLLKVVGTRVFAFSLFNSKLCVCVCVREREREREIYFTIKHLKQ